MVMDETQVEHVLEQCKMVLEEEPERFNKWERGFIESVSDQNECGHLSQRQLDKLETIWMNRV